VDAAAARARRGPTAAARIAAATLETPGGQPM